MRKVLISFLQPGLKVGRPVYDSNGRVLLNKGVILSTRYIERLKKLGIPAIYIDDGWLPDVEIEDVISEQTRLQAISQVKALFSADSRTKAAKAFVIVKQIEEIVKNIVDELLDNKYLIVNLTDIRALDEYTFGHSVNVCVLAIITGITLGYSRVKLMNLGMAALLHDIGKTRISPQILNKPGSLSKEEFEEVKKHTTYGAQILKQTLGANKICELIALQHHERYSGQGYPEGLKGKDIHEFARITGLVDMYDALVADRVYRKAYPVHEAYEMIAGSGNFLFDFKIVEAFLQNIAAYPAGSLVRLNTGEIGVVVETIRGFPLHPKVRVLFSRQGEPLANPNDVWLGENRNLTIVEVIENLNELGLQESIIP